MWKGARHARLPCAQRRLSRCQQHQPLDSRSVTIGPWSVPIGKWVYWSLVGSHALRRPTSRRSQFLCPSHHSPSVGASNMGADPAVPSTESLVVSAFSLLPSTTSHICLVQPPLYPRLPRAAILDSSVRRDSDLTLQIPYRGPLCTRFAAYLLASAWGRTALLESARYAMSVRPQPAFDSGEQLMQSFDAEKVLRSEIGAPFPLVPCNFELANN